MMFIISSESSLYGNHVPFLSFLHRLMCVVFPPQSFFSKRRVSNLEAYVEWFNRLSYLVATEICLVSILV